MIVYIQKQSLPEPHKPSGWHWSSFLYWSSFCSPQPGTSWSCDVMDVGLVYCMLYTFMPRLWLVLVVHYCKRVKHVLLVVTWTVTAVVWCAVKAASVLFPGPSCDVPENIDYDFAQQELMLQQMEDDPIQVAIRSIEKQHEEDKQGKHDLLSLTLW